jgi:hypothetical protein
VGFDPFQEHVELAEPDPVWAERYAQEAALIAGALEHIGSTSVPLRVDEDGGGRRKRRDVSREVDRTGRIRARARPHAAERS